MKPRHLLLPAMAAFLAISISSCEQLKSKLFQSFIAKTLDVDFTIPIVNTTAMRSDMGSVTNFVNLDSIIKAETGNAFSINDIKSVTVESCELNLLNPDQNNNFANFEEGWVSLHSDVNTTPIEINTGMNPDVYSTKWILPEIAGVELKGYLTGKMINYVFAAKARRVTTKDLNCRLTVQFRVE